MSHKQQYTAHEHETPDSWHRHIIEDEGAPQEEHGRTNPAALVIGLLACIAFVGGTILASWLYFNVYVTNLRRSKIESDTLAREFFGTARPATLAKLNDYSFATEDAARKGVASLPIDKAMQNVVAKYGKK
jgi:hypothetical protein